MDCSEMKSEAASCCCCGRRSLFQQDSSPPLPFSNSCALNCTHAAIQAAVRLVTTCARRGQAYPLLIRGVECFWDGATVWRARACLRFARREVCYLLTLHKQRGLAVCFCRAERSALSETVAPMPLQYPRLPGRAVDGVYLNCGHVLLVWFKSFHAGPNSATCSRHWHGDSDNTTRSLACENLLNL